MDLFNFSTCYEKLGDLSPHSLFDHFYSNDNVAHFRYHSEVAMNISSLIDSLALKAVLNGKDSYRNNIANTVASSATSVEIFLEFFFRVFEARFSMKSTNTPLPPYFDDLFKALSIELVVLFNVPSSNDSDNVIVRSLQFLKEQKTWTQMKVHLDLDGAHARRIIACPAYALQH